jgi:hypothetical protein
VPFFPANVRFKRVGRPGDYTGCAMWEAYRIGLAAGIGVGLGVLFSGLLAGTRIGAVVAFLLGAAAGAGIGFVIDDWQEAIGGGVGGLAGALGATVVVGGALRRGGTRLGTALLVGAGAVVLVGLAFVPFVGYLETVAVPALGARLRRRGGERYAGLRILARD